MFENRIKSIFVKTILPAFGVVTILIFPVFSAPKSSDTIPISLTISGGTSLGCYQAGYQYVTTDWLRKNRNVSRIHSVTGSSAGAINALLTVLSLADTSFVQDTASIFYKSWIPICYDSLKGGSSPLGVFSRSFLYKLSQDFIYPMLDSGNAAEDLDVVLGITATQVNPELVPLKNNLRSATSEDKFTIRMRKKAGRQAWQLSNYIDTSLKNPIPVLPLRIGSDPITITSLVFASSGFPGAFPPEMVSQKRIVPADWNGCTLHWDSDTVVLWKELASPCKEVKPVDSTVSPYIDGGVFDSSPLSLACDVVCNGTTQNDTTHWAPAMSWQPANRRVSNTLFLYLSQNNVMYPEQKMHSAEASTSITKSFAQLGKNFVSCARDKELAGIREKYPLFDQSLQLTQSYAPPLSGYLGAFLGFFERRFRVSDFYLGMYDAQRYLAKTVSYSKAENSRASVLSAPPQSTGSENADIRFQLTQQVLDLILDVADRIKVDSTFKPDTTYWKDSIQKINEWYTEHMHSAGCGAFEFQQHAILLQSCVDRLWGRWIAAFANPGTWDFDTTNAAHARHFLDITHRPTFFNLPEITDEEFLKNVITPIENEAEGKKGANEFDALLYLLDIYDYTYQDIVPNQKASAEYAKMAIGERFDEMATLLGKNQKSHLERFAFKLLARPVTNFFIYTPPRRSLRITGGFDGIELGWTYRPWNSDFFNRLRFDLFLHGDKGSKANIDYDDQHKWRQWVPSAAIGLGGMIDLARWNPVGQLKYGTNATFGKDYKVNHMGHSYRKYDWSAAFYPIILQGSLFDMIILRVSYGFSRRCWFKDMDAFTWDKARFDLQLGIQFVR